MQKDAQRRSWGKQVENEVVLLQAKECQGLSGPTRESEKKGAFRGSVALPTPYFRFLASRTVREFICVV